jgi:glycosyltransferase involved in cell wall biosynthesis
MQPTYKAAILLATYNGAHYLGEFLDSLVAQKGAEFEIFVRDDGSSDATLEVLRTYSGKLRITQIPASERKGPAFSFLALLQEAGQDFDAYFFADQDDFWHEDKLGRALRFLSGHEDSPSLYFARVEYVDHQLRHLGFMPKSRHMGLPNALVENIAMGCTIALNAKARELVLSAAPASVIMHDWWAYIVISAFGKVVADDFVSLKYRLHGTNTVGASIGWFQEYWKKFKRFMKRDRGIFRLSDQTRQLQQSYSKMLSPDQQDLIQMMLRGKQSFLARIRLAILCPFIRQRRIDSAILRVLFLLNRY